MVRMNCFEIANRYVDAGLCVLPANKKEKRPTVGSWKPYQDRLPIHDELHRWFDHDTSFCLVTGKASDNLEMIDFDRGGELFGAWAEKLPSQLLDKLVVETSQSGGRHVVYHCAEPVCGNIKLAQRTIDGEIITLIETRGEGGIILCAPTPGYELIQGELVAIPVLAVDEREALLVAAWELNEHCPEPPPEAVQTAPLAHSGDAIGDTRNARPGDGFNTRGDVAALLKKHGWRTSGERSDGNQHWTRPGKPFGTSATLKDGKFYVFSSNSHPFTPNNAYSPFAVYALLEHDGDFETAASELGRQGYGETSMPDGDVDLSRILMIDNAPEETAIPVLPDPGPVPLELLRAPGFISEVMDFCLETAPYPNPVMAFCGALALQAFLAGRKVRDPGDNRKNLYLLGLAHSSAGKDWPRKLNTRILHKVGLADGLGESFASGEGIQGALFLSPCMLFQTDEIDGMLQSIKKSRDARHENVMSTLLTLYSSANSIFPMRRKAGKESPGVIDQPTLVIYGTAIPKHYYGALSERMLTNGFFARMLILECGKRGAGQEPQIRDLPNRIIETATWWHDFLPGDGNLRNWNPVPAIVPHDDYAKQLLVATRKEADLHVSETDFEHRCRQVIELLHAWRETNADAWMTYSDITRKLRWTRRDHDEVRDALLDQGLIESDVLPTGGRPKRVYRLQTDERRSA